MATTNNDRVTNALNVLKNGLRPFVEREIKARYGSQWEEMCRSFFPAWQRSAQASGLNWDIQAILQVMWDQWNECFRKTLGPSQRSLVSEIREWRNKWAHQVDLPVDDAYRAIDSVYRLLAAVSSPLAEEVKRIRAEAFLAISDEGMRSPKAAAAVAAPAAATPDKEPPPIVTPDEEGVKRGVRLFAHLAEAANRGNATGISYGGFIAYWHGVDEFRNVSGRSFRQSDAGVAVRMAQTVTEKAGRKQVTRSGRTIRAGMDTFIWRSQRPFDRSSAAWTSVPTVPYSREDWLSIFPNGEHRLISIIDLSRLIQP